MANSIDFILTTAADKLISKVLAGKTLNFTRMTVGDGFSYDINIAKGFKSLVNEVLSLDITKKETLSASNVRITAAFKNTDAQQEFYYREVGLYAQDPDTGEEVLYAYGNRNDAAELITPAGSNIVTKQLVFIISVGDSANVTFNVNADVYALQEDMLDVQANKADKNLANTGTITNCLLEVPQNIKLELTNGVLTLKAGSKVYIPNGPGVFDEITVGNDLQLIGSIISETSVFVFYRDGNLVRGAVSDTTSGTTPPTTGILFNTDDNMIKFYLDGVVSTTGYSLPLAIVTMEGNNTAIVTSIDQVFNGMGYIGSTVWVDKGVKGLIPNGRNADGTLKNIEITVPQLTLGDFNTSNYENIDFRIDANKVLGHNFLIETDSVSLNNSTRSYIPTKNLIYKWDNSIAQELFVAKGTIEQGIITFFQPYTTFQTVNYNDYKNRLSKLESRISALETN